MTIFNKNYFIAVDFYSNFQELDTLKNNPKTVNVIQCCKSNLSQHGIPDVAVADTAQQFDCKEFEQFAKQWEFGCSPSDP